MRGTARARAQSTGRPAGTGRIAVVWIDSGRAVMARDEAGVVDEAEVMLPEVPAAAPPALAEVAHWIGAADRVLVLGPDDLRTVLEREIVALGHAPESIREVPVEGPVDHEALLERLRRLA